jgi:hypothetical protein
MKKLLFILSLFLSFTINAQIRPNIISSQNSHFITYYISLAGDDGNTGLDPNHPWATINKVNTVWTAGTFNPGNRILFNRGNIFYGTITVKESGSVGHPIIVGAYGMGANPIITGFITIPSWVSSGKGVYYYDITCASATNNIITVDGINIPMGRWPKTGWLVYDSHSGTTSITDNDLANTPNWTGAELVIRKINWTLERSPITDHSTHVITYTKFSDVSPNDGYGYFIQNDLKTLDTDIQTPNIGDWYYTGTRLYMYFGAIDPATKIVKISNLDKLLTSGATNSTHFDYITLIGVDFEGSSLETVELTNNTNNWVIQNCGFNYSGKNCIDGGQYIHDNLITNNIINNTNNNAIRSIYEGYQNTITYNTITNTGVFHGMVYSDDDGADAIVLKDDGSGNATYDVVSYNTITNVGHSGIRVRYSNYIVSYNVINTFALTKNDAGGLYTWGTYYTTFDHNIILNGYGNSGGVLAEPAFNPPDPYWTNVVGIYIDEICNHITITNNTTANNRDAGIFVQMAEDITITGNTSYNNGWFQLGLWQRLATDVYPVRNIVMNNNIFFCKAARRTLYPYMQLCGQIQTWENDFSSFGTFDYNYYARPIDNGTNTNVFQTLKAQSDSPWYGTAYTITGWRTLSGQDAHSTGSLGTAISDTANIHFIYNDTRVNKTFTLSAGMTDVANTSYSGDIEVAPYSSLILLGEGNIE